MAEIIAVTHLPAALQANELVESMVSGANAKASRVAPCLVDPTSAVWAATTAYAVADRVKVNDYEFLEAMVAGTSGVDSPTSPSNIGDTVIDGTVTWKRIAPTLDQIDEARLILLGAVRRWDEAGSGALASEQQTVGPFSQGMTVDTRQRTGYNLWPSEVKALRDICSAGTDSVRAFSFSPFASISQHAPWCSLHFGATYCSCGADIAGYPLYEST